MKSISQPQLFTFHARYIKHDARQINNNPNSINKNKKTQLTNNK